MKPYMMSCKHQKWWIFYTRRSSEFDEPCCKLVSWYSNLSTMSLSCNWALNTKTKNSNRTLSISLWWWTTSFWRLATRHVWWAKTRWSTYYQRTRKISCRKSWFWSKRFWYPRTVFWVRTPQNCSCSLRSFWPLTRNSRCCLWQKIRCH